MAAIYVLKQSGEGNFLFTLQAPGSGGRVYLTSPSFRDKHGALCMINAVRSLAGRDKNYEVRTAENGQPYFVLKNARQEVIGQSETYADSHSLPAGIASVKVYAPESRREITKACAWRAMPREGS